jgi:spore maturation protein SpmA/spore maturation protein SpmB
MLNFIWLGLIGLAVLIGGFRGNIGQVSDAAIEYANTAVLMTKDGKPGIAFGLIAIMTLWMGLMRLADKAGLVHRLGLALKPIMIWLFPEVPPDHPAMGAMIMNVAANILGLNNAATPLGLRAMNELETLNKRPGVATNAMCMLLAINTSSITLIPVTVIGLLVLNGGKNPTAIIGTSLVATAIAHIAAIGTCKLLEKSPWFRLPPIDETIAPPEPIDAPKTATAAQGKEVAEKATQSDELLPWVPGSRWILAGVAGLFLAMLLATAFPELIGGQPSAAALTYSYPHRLVDALSLLAIPWLILFFPLFASLRRIPVYEEFVEGGKEGFQVILRILPYIVGMFVAIGMFRAAGGLDLIKSFLQPITDLFHFPSELVPIAVIRPFSGSAAYAMLGDLVKTNGPDNLTTLMGATFYGCSETTFYVIAVYFGSVGIRKTRHAIPAGLVADIIGPIASVIVCRAMLS